MDYVRNTNETDTGVALLHQSHTIEGKASEFSLFSESCAQGECFRKVT